jgi:exopolyphosphatase/guanosine-5'-triphosphate,3'-diphosphate pyrophosphatase
VYQKGFITPGKIEMMKEGMKAFHHLMNAYNVRDYEAFATSAMREAKNREEVISIVRDHSNIDISVISGKKEASIFFSEYFMQWIDDDKNYLLIDVGGGSTEITVLKGLKKVHSRSFKLGTVRLLNNKNVSPTWKQIKSWIEEIRKEVPLHKAMGTGGNINSLFKLCQVINGNEVSLSQLEHITNMLDKMTFEEKMIKLSMRPDRADVITLASQIFINTMIYAKLNMIIVPKLGLADGMIYEMHKRHTGSLKQNRCA